MKHFTVRVLYTAQLRISKERLEAFYLIALRPARQHSIRIRKRLIAAGMAIPLFRSMVYVLATSVHLKLCSVEQRGAFTVVSWDRMEYVMRRVFGRTEGIGASAFLLGSDVCSFCDQSSLY
jgi:hypothetical protein